MATLSAQVPTAGGIALSWTAADVAGDIIAYQPKRVVLIRNEDASPITVTIPVHRLVAGGASSAPDVSVAVAAGATQAVALHPDMKDATDGDVDLAYSAVANVTVAVLDL